MPSILIPQQAKVQESVNIFSDVSDTEPIHEEIKLASDSKLEAPSISAS